MKRMLAMLPLLLYLLALNPWFLPGLDDDVMHFFGGLSLAESGIFAMNGQPIIDGPPGFAACLAFVFNIGLDEVYFGKLLVLAFIVGGLFLLPNFLRKEDRPYPHLTYAIVLLLPGCMLAGTQIMSEWPFMMLSIAFLHTLRRLRFNKPDWRWTVSAGILLGAAALTHIAGSLLLVALLAQWIRRAKKNRACDSRLLGEIFVGIIGCVLFIAWKLRCDGLVDNGLAEGSMFTLPPLTLATNPFGSITQIANSLFALPQLVTQLGAPGLLVGLLGLLLFALVVLGFVRQVRAHEIQPVDWYVLSTLLVIIFTRDEPYRLFVPLAPFLVGYTLRGIQELSKGKRLMPVLLTVWMGGLLTLNSIPLIKGADDHRGLSPLFTRDAAAFYKNDWSDLYQACMHLDARLPPGPIGAVGPHSKYLLAFANRPYKPYHHPSIVGILAYEDQPPPDARWVAQRTFGAYTLYAPRAPLFTPRAPLRDR